MLLSLGAQFSPDADGHTPLHLAAFENHHQIAALFLQSGVNPSAKNSDGATAAHLAADNGSLETLKLLARSKALRTFFLS